MIQLKPNGYFTSPGVGQNAFNRANRIHPPRFSAQTAGSAPASQGWGKWATGLTQGGLEVWLAERFGALFLSVALPAAIAFTFGLPLIGKAVGCKFVEEAGKMVLNNKMEVAQKSWQIIRSVVTLPTTVFPKSKDILESFARKIRRRAFNFFKNDTVKEFVVLPPGIGPKASHFATKLFLLCKDSLSRLADRAGILGKVAKKVLALGDAPGAENTEARNVLDEFWKAAINSAPKTASLEAILAKEARAAEAKAAQEAARAAAGTA
jgi:hypothetical protein